MLKSKVVIIEDDSVLREAMGIYLMDLNLNCLSFKSAEEFLSYKNHSLHDIYIVDINLPNINGIEIVKFIRSQNRLAYIQIISGSVDENDITLGLMAGADDYIPKPFNMSHLLTKIQNAKAKSISFANYDIKKVTKLFSEDNLILSNGKNVNISTSESHLLKELFKNKGRVVYRDKLQSCISSSGKIITLEFHICSIRKKIRGTPLIIETVRGKGYRLKEKGLQI